MAKKVENIKRKIKVAKPETKEIWINPADDYGCTLMISGVLKHIYDSNPLQKFNLVHRTISVNFLKEHPAIKHIGYPPKDAKVITTDYWNVKNFDNSEIRAFQALAAKLGVKTPIEEKLFLSGKCESDPILDRIIPWKKKNIIIAPSSDSPRKMLHPMVWHNIVERLRTENILVLQAGSKKDIHIKGAYSLLNLTSPRQLISLIKKCNFVVCLDNFVMHAAHLLNKPAVVIWGPTKSNVYGYAEQIHIQAPLEHCEQKNKCFDLSAPQNFQNKCPLDAEHCMNKIPLEKILNAIFTIL